MGRRGRGVALLLAAAVLAGCTTPTAPTPTATPTAALPERGPITLAVESGAAAALARPVAAWNGGHPGEPVTLVELPPGDGRRAPQLAEKAEAGSGEYTVMLLESAATTEFAARGWLAELPQEEFPVAGVDAAALASGTYRGTRYALPLTRDVGVLLYRADLLDRYGIDPPTTWTQLKAACARVRAAAPGLDCYAGQLGPHPDLAGNVAEAIWSAGGELVTAAGQPDVASVAAASGLGRIAADVAGGLVPEASLDWSGDRARRAFGAGELVFLRDWWSARAAIEPTLSAQLGVALLPGEAGPGVATLGGRNLGISAHARNTGTAADFVEFLMAADQQRSLARAGFGVPALTEVAAEADLREAVPALATANTALASARPLPAVVEYRESVRAVRELCLPAIKGDREPADALADLQSRLEELQG